MFLLQKFKRVQTILMRVGLLGQVVLGKC